MHRPPKKLNPIAVPESVFPDPIITPENQVDKEFLHNLMGGIALLNHVCVERIGNLLQAAKGEHEKLKDGHPSFDAIREVKEAVKDFTAAATDLQKRAKFNELMQDPARVEAMIEMLGRVPTIDQEEKESMARSLREMSERYLEFGPVGLLNELELAKTARMLDTVIKTIQYYLENEKGFSEMFRTSLDLYLMSLEEYRAYIANRMVYFLEIRQEKLHAKTEDFGFGDLCRSWMVLDRAPPDEKIAHQFDNLMERFITTKTMQTKWEEGEIDLLQSLPQNPLSDHPSATNINDYFYLYVNQFGGIEARMRLLGCGASLSPEYRDDSWGAWFNWMGRGFQHAAAVVQKIPKAVLPSASDSPPLKATGKADDKGSVTKSADEMLIERNKRLYGALKNVIDSVNCYMRPVPEECLRDPNEVLANARKLISSIERAQWNYKGEHYADLCQRAYMGVLALIFENMIDYMGTSRAKLFTQLLSNTTSVYVRDLKPRAASARSFDGDENLNLYYDRVGQIENAEEAVMQAILLCVKYKDYSNQDPVVIAHFYELASRLMGLRFMTNKSDAAVIKYLASLMLQLRDCAGGDFKREINDFIAVRLGCDSVLIADDKPSHLPVVDQYETSFRTFEYLLKLRQQYFPAGDGEGRQHKLNRRPSLFLLEIYEKMIRNQLLCQVVQALLHDKSYEVPKDLLIETRNYLAGKIKSDPDDVISHAKYLCLECAMVSRSSRHEKALMAVLQDLGRLETDYYQHPDEKCFGTEERRREVTLSQKKNEFEKMQYLMQLLSRVPMLKGSSSSELYVNPSDRLKSLQQIVGKRLLALKQEMNELTAKPQVVTKK